MVLIQILFFDQMMFWSFEFFGRDWLRFIWTTEIIDFIDLRVNIRNSNQYRPKNSKLQNVIWSEKQIWIKTIDSRQQTVQNKSSTDLVT